MKTSLKITFLLVTIIVLLTTTAMAVSNYQINWWTIDGGGGISKGGGYTLQGTIGQPDTGSSGGGEYGLGGGFWAGLREWFGEFFIHLPIVLK